MKSWICDSVTANVTAAISCPLSKIEGCDGVTVARYLFMCVCARVKNSINYCHTVTNGLDLSIHAAQSVTVLLSQYLACCHGSIGRGIV